ncbi:MAG: SpoIIE family protein phosphatase [Candidatus Riflebacteria bacterium]
MLPIIRKGFCAIFIGMIVPALTFYFGFDYYLQTLEKLQENRLISIGESISGQAIANADNSRFWCQEMNRTISRSSSLSDFLKSLKEKCNEAKLQVSYLCWENNGKTHVSENISFSRTELAKIGGIMRHLLSNPGGRVDPMDDLFMRYRFGPHFQARRLYESWRLNKPNLVETDFDYHYPLAWGGQHSDFIVLVLFPTSVLQKDHGLQFLKRRLTIDLPNEYNFAVIRDGKLVSTSYVEINNLKKIKDDFLKQPGNIIASKGQLLFMSQLDDETWFFMWQKFQKLNAARSAVLVLILTGFFLLILLREYNFFRALAEIRIKRLIFGFITISNLFPMVAIVFFFQQYLEQKKIVMMEEIRNNSVNFIQMFESEFVNEINRFPRKVRLILNRNLDKLRLKKVCRDDVISFHKELIDLRQTFKLVASSTDFIMTDEGLISDGQFFNMQMIDPSKGPDRADRIFGKISRAFLGFWNQEPISSKELTETELVTDVLFQKPVDESLHLFVEMHEHMQKFGIGTDQNPSFVGLISMNQDDKGDYFGLFEFRQGEGALDFLTRLSRERIGNQYGLKLVFSKEKLVQPHSIFPFKDPVPFSAIVNSLKKHPPMSAEVLEIDDQKWICSAFSSSILKIDMIALYPVKEIEIALAREQFDLAVLLILNFSVIFAIAITLSEMLLKPVVELEKGTMAIMQKNYTYRLPNLGDDEFGKMGRIFNEAIADLEDLSIARVVQQQLFPSKPIVCPPYSLFGKSVTLADLGGDYYDFFMVGDNSFSAMIGDVAGHGVGAAMIMAMAKAVTINSNKCFNHPEEYLNRLHQIVLSSKNRRQKKVMTMQFIHVDKIQQKVTFSNAGGCNPFILNGKSGRFEEVIMPGPVLGAFKKATYKEMQIELLPGDVMIFYTDGIIEARNASGTEIGYPGFKEILQKNYSADPELFYHRVFNDYLAFLGQTRAQDDLTMLFLARSK